MKQLVAALDAAKTDDQRLAALLAVWRETRSPRVANAIDRLASRGIGAKEVTVWQRTAKLPGSRAKTAVLQLAKKVDDPRLASMYVTWLGQGNWPAPTAKPVWTRIFEHLVALGDARTREPLRGFAEALPAFFVGAEHRAWLVAQIEATAKKIAAPKAEAAALATALATIEPLLGEAPKPAADPKAAVESVWKSPDDLDLRQVVADALLEHEDPWGEFISIQLRGAKTTSKERTRAKQLEKKHGGSWLGAIGKLAVTSSWEFEHGFPVGVGVDRRRVHRRDWEAALLAPQWATIRTLKVSILETPMWWITEWVKSPATRSVRAFDIDSYKYKKKNDPQLRLEREPGHPWRLVRVMRNYSSSFKVLQAFAAGLTPAERAKVVIGDAPAVADREQCVAIFD